jgi:hypothetical protein
MEVLVRIARASLLEATGHVLKRTSGSQRRVAVFKYSMNTKTVLSKPPIPSISSLFFHATLVVDFEFGSETKRIECNRTIALVIASVGFISKPEAWLLDE